MGSSIFVALPKKTSKVYKNHASELQEAEVDRGDNSVGSDRWNLFEFLLHVTEDRRAVSTEEDTKQAQTAGQSSTGQVVGSSPLIIGGFGARSDTKTTSRKGLVFKQMCTSCPLTRSSLSLSSFLSPLSFYQFDVWLTDTDLGILIQGTRREHSRKRKLRHTSLGYILL